MLKILALGDSLTAGYGLSDSESYPVKLQAALKAKGIDAQVINGGVSGDTSAGGLARLDWALQDDPDIVIVELGANDGLRGLDPVNTQENLDAVLKRLTDDKRAVLLTGMLAPPNMGRDYGDAFKKIYPALAAKYGVRLYPFFLDGVAADPALNQADGIHPTGAGVDIIVARILPDIMAVIDALRGTASGG
ncbi:MAG TPA: arylesterase [Verrucomicrobiae bacterium]|nr:arylesterase [Verrucomicrobiae bacterium]